MHNIYIDLTHSIPVKNTKYHGGMTYTIRLLELINSMPNTGKSIYILWPKYHDFLGIIGDHIRNSQVFKIIEVDHVDENIQFKNSSVLFFPLLSVKSWKIARQIKSKFPEIKIYITVHGFRFLDLKIDRYSKYYDENIGNWVFSSLKNIMEKILYKNVIKRDLSYFDKVFTVSNFSLQQIITFSNVKKINYYYQGISISNEPIKYQFKEEYILFVSGNRPVKNFIRALEAFCRYKIKTKNNVFMYVTGIDDYSKINMLSHFNDTDKKLIEKWVKFFDYVEEKFLNDLYRQCKFFLFTSLSEGFGLPVMEAIFYGRPVVASYVNSIPEVGGSAVYYVNPYDVGSIEVGIDYMNRTENLKKYEELTNCKALIMKDLIKYDNEALINEILY